MNAIIPHGGEVAEVLKW